MATVAGSDAKTPLRQAAAAAPEVTSTPAAQADSRDIAIDWKDVCYTLKAPKDGQPDRVILKDAYGRCDAGELAAVMGPSGSGKTSLLNALAGRLPVTKGATVSGTVTVEAGGKAFLANNLDLATVSAYVEQDDALFALSTVEETLMMVARLRMPELTSAQRQARVTEVIRLLGLAPAKDTPVGSDKPGQRGISGGERKRVHLGLELLHRPRLIFVDEPTTGLDSFQAQNVMQTLKELAKAGHTVLCTIHQPRSSIYQMLDKVILMAGGEMAYYGPSGGNAATHFQQINFPVPSDFNPADHFLDLISIDYRSQADEAKTKEVVQTVVSSCPALKSRQTLPLQPAGAPLPPALQAEERRRAGCFTAFDLLTLRTWRELTRDKVTLTTKLCAQAFFSMVFASIYWQMDMTQTSLQNRIGILFFMAMNQAFGGVIGVSQVIPRQLKVVARERANRLYGALPFYLATFICQLPLELVPQLIFGAIVYTLTGLRPGYQHMLTYVGVLMLENFAGIALGMMLSCSFTSVEQAPQLAPMAVILFLMFSGFLLNQASIPKIYTPLKYISFVRYSFESLAVNELKGNNGFTCPKTRFMPCFQGDDYLERLNFGEVSIFRNCCILGVEILVFNILAFLILVGKRPKFMQPVPSADIGGA
mmetsp:Transcript_64926/g.155084  ORF Transcript_64926/g.155084 Transcript_64926/m.155084 type:complete len:649 (+) Transcript_64926:66-2012(+)